MKVADLQHFIRSLAAPLKTAGAKQVASEIEQACAGLEPFKDLGVGQFADFLAKADGYARTGVLPVDGKARKSAKAADPNKVKQTAQAILALYERATDPEIQYTTIEAEIKKLDKALSKDEAVEVAREVGIVATLKTKKDSLAAIHRRIAERKETFQRTQF